MFKKSLLFLFLNIPFVLADEELPLELSQKNIDFNYMQMFFGLFLVIGLVYLTAFIYQKLLKIKVTPQEDEINKPKLVSSLNLGPNKNIHLIKINDEHILVGATQNSINYIKNIDI